MTPTTPITAPAFVIDRTPAVAFSNVVHNDPTDRFGRDRAYLANPRGWVKHCFARARALAAPMLRFIKPDGHDTSLQLYRAGMFLDQDANETLYEETAAFKREGGKVALYTGRINPKTSGELWPGDPFLDVFQPFIKSGGARIDFDNTGDNPKQQLALHGWAAGQGIGSGGEAICAIQPAGMAGAYVPASSTLHTNPWLCGSDFLAGRKDSMGRWIVLPRDPNRIWGFNPATSEVRCIVDASHFASPAECVEFVHSLRSRSIIPEQGGDPVAPEVTAAIFAVSAPGGMQ